jgi:diadenosine tetraphosphatase ApaH/serine/threonine PP2A family protein phosphatase
MAYAHYVAVLVIADVHANFPAFEAVLEQATVEAEIDTIWCLGDLVGYGARPAECIALLRRYSHLIVAGNHDLAAAGVLGTEDFNAVAAAAALWTAETLDEDSRAFIRGLPLTIIEGEFTLVHGSLRDPVWDYLTNATVAARHLAQQTTPYGLVGHSHVPLIFHEDGRQHFLRDRDVVALEDSRFVANPGGLGQPRDGDPRAPYALLDLESRQLTFRRVAYDLALAQAAIRDAGLPDFLADRLSVGR